MEDGIFPSYMTISTDDTNELEEERRLAYVAITRAKEDLTITAARQRMLHGQTQYNPLSRFVKEIPEELMDQKPLKQKQRFDDYEPDYYTKTQIASNPYAIGGNHKVTDYYGVKKSMPKANVSGRVAGTGTGLGSLQGLQGLQKGMPAAGDKPDYEVGDRVKHVNTEAVLF